MIERELVPIPSRKKGEFAKFVHSEDEALKAFLNQVIRVTVIEIDSLEKLDKTNRNFFRWIVGNILNRLSTNYTLVVMAHLQRFEQWSKYEFEYMLWNQRMFEFKMEGQ